jgi:TetR/AcrR family transcriptional regulator, fatty acid metabolism regulator protein
MVVGTSTTTSATTSATTRTPSLKERQRQEREQLILQAAHELLFERGYHDMSIDDLAARVGISKGTVYLHFASKEDLVLALLERGRRDLLQTLDAILSSNGTPREKLRAILERVYSGMSCKQFQVISTVFQNPAMFGRLAEKRQALVEAWDAPMERIAAVLDEGKAQGEFDTAFPTPIMLSLFRSLLTPHAYQRLVVQEGMPPDAVVRYLTQFFFKGIAAGDVGQVHPGAAVPGNDDAD